MPQGKHEPRPPQEPVAPWEEAPEEREAEPDWAEEIRAGRRARGERLKEVFAAFDDDPGDGRGPVPPPRR
jgi:hypothetical protein